MGDDVLPKAAGEIAKAVAVPAADLLKALGGYVAHVAGSVPSDLVGVAGGDLLSELRRRNLARLQEKTQRLLDGIDASRRSTPSPSIVAPLLMAAADETREELQDLWAALLANTLVDGARRVRREFFDALKLMEPMDAGLLQMVLEVTSRPRADQTMSGIGNRWEEVIEMASGRGYEPGEIAISARNLVKLDCVNLSSTPLLSQFGRMLLTACQGPAP